ncbi:MAG: hypothetical protein ACFE0Q_18225 [Anaerolineae bacterium]
MSEQIKPKKDKRLNDGDKPLLYTESLMEIFDFDRDAVLSNAQGFVTRHQKERIADTLREEADSMWLMVTIFLGTAVVLAMIFSLQGYAPLPLVIGVGLVIGTLLLIAYNRQSVLKADTNRLRTLRVEGEPEIRATLSGDKQAELVIAEKKLPISYQQAAALNEFVLPALRVYYAANSNQILSAEVLPDVGGRKLKNEDLMLEADDAEIIDYDTYDNDDTQQRTLRP